ncbi:tRNA (uridine(54)-C5)-methyltransferase TrmA [Sansalvadorimonas sp. 2012CJ34-2]|uniref:tRNA/tmRNA (uracil-C(5))-methyltransferase n=1 Tax=Parendozoicomonas callyspongiae TaxID=2942213 RepID=A0ABT0PGK6_9GAMM|nr:tRNA (uridine(54)-C5)-methyltransferase TrmA [Sansalvadorimonas sp. 2012CJ34-2]MCL6270513.1 tRNA (uridine(54)-C5)-methyltransferase TrmA [Sansalvadorimonas sp. 2012CJ34-2]
MSTGTTYPERYEALLSDKAERLKQLFSDFQIPEPEVFTSAPENFRMRAEFRVWHEGDQTHYIMFDQETREKVQVTEFPIGSTRINELMRPVMDALCQQEILRRKLFQVEFLTTQAGEAIVSLLYHKQLSEEWEAAARPLRDQFGIEIIGRARKQKIVLDRDYVTEELNVCGRLWRYNQVENSFTQPNAGINEKMLSWAQEVTSGSASEEKSDLVELYCGNGNFTCILAQNFDQVLATEISKSSVNSAHKNFEMNAVDNVTIARMSSEEFTQALNKERPFRRLAHVDLDSYNFSTIFVDPPRAGLDPATEALVQRFDRIVYVSCNPVTLKENLETLSQTHRIEKLALFDQFPYTDHIESGVLLTRK